MDTIHNPQIIRICLENERRYHKFRELAAPNLQAALAEEFEINQPLVSRIAAVDQAWRKVTPETAAEIRRRLPIGQKYQALANRFSQRQTALRLGIATSSINMILRTHSTLANRAVRRPRTMDSPVTRFLTMRTPTQERHHEAA